MTEQTGSRDGTGCGDHDIAYRFGQPVSLYLPTRPEARLAVLRSREDIAERRLTIRGITPVALAERPVAAPAERPVGKECSGCGLAIPATANLCVACEDIAARSTLPYQPAAGDGAPEFDDLPF